MDDIAETLKNNLRKAFNMDAVDKRLAEREKQQQAQAQAAAPAVPQPKPTDIYRLKANAQFNESKKSRPKGSPALVRAVTKSVIEGDSGEGLAVAKKIAESDIDSLKAKGEKGRANMLTRQYMEERFLPAVEVVVNYCSPDELLNCKEALSALDKMALGTGSMSGYTAAYVRQAYGDQLGQRQGGSDPTVIDQMRRIRMLVGADQIRTAVGLAQKIKKKIDEGEHSASDEDYALLGRMVAYAN